MPIKTKKIVKTDKSTLVNFRATQSFKAQMDRTAKLEGVKTSVLIREAIEAKIRYSEALQGDRKQTE